ncbi:hypothetical protein DO021_16580 [Desulfobacter hydrogenophilus]|uniref:Uncharacterized protein n=1 Tax=Desulfobacter hydrogenophilus TaxID=2291 RepID=A0A328FB20_9BACT|nr:hypothetical protein [Desulfobacter hydrogenophilus]NDY73032.1 hypothetical protein [Desulfobacter hydrogenophilus]QBH14715.1 hypothetical protein EYB58_18405 [Desulfobacter hydrogenophilus]RAM00880.1 hypothetical protein DO021_16580 [Desulfobacter hydrogenophilus]
MSQQPPVEFSIVNKSNDESVIYIIQDASKNELVFTFTYGGSSPITLKGGTLVDEGSITSAGPTSLYFTITTILTSEEFAALKVTPPKGWQAHRFTSWALTPIEDIVVNSGDNFSFTLSNISAGGQAGPGSFNVDYYNIPGVADFGIQLNLFLEELPTTHNKLRDVLALSFVDGNEVFINVNDQDQIPSNTLILRLDNTSAKPIVPTGTTPTKTPVFYLSFVTAKQAPGYGALATIDRTKDIRVGIYKDYGTQWTIQDRTQFDPPHWAIYPKSPEILGTGAKAIAEFRIENIVTDFEPSSTNLYLQSSNIPNYDDGCQALVIEKQVPKLAIKVLEAQQNNVESGTEVELTWKTFNANRCTLSPVNDGNIDVPIQENGGYKVYPARTTTYTLTAYDDQLATKTAKTVTVDVLDVKIINFQATPATGAHYGDPVTLTWDTLSAVTCTVEPPINGTQKVPNNSTATIIHPTDTVHYTLTANGQGGPVSSELDVFPIPNGWKKKEIAGPWDTWGRPVILSFSNRLWFLAGGTEDVNSWVFNTRDGFNWHVVTNNAAFSPRGQSAGCVFDNKMWLMGGESRIDAGSSRVVDEIWYSTDGAIWTQAAATGHWSARSGLGCIAFSGKLWVMGGVDASGTRLKDVWSSTDGVTWEQETEAAIWPARSEFGLTVFNQKLCIVAGMTADGVLADAWQSRDGIYWSGLGGLINWQARSGANVHAIGSNLYVIGGKDQYGNTISDNNILGSDGNWNMGLGPGWRNSDNEGSATFYGAIWFTGGTINGASNNKTVWAFGPP